MRDPSMAKVVKDCLHTAASTLKTTSPVPVLGDLIDRTFTLPPGSPEYGANHLCPECVPLEPSFSEREPGALRFTLQPLEPTASASARQHEATLQMRRLAGTAFGPDALYWFDERSEPFRGSTSHARSEYGAWFGAAFDSDGLRASKVYYEMYPGLEQDLPPDLRTLAQVAMDSMPGLVPIFTTIRCGRHEGVQRLTFLHPGPLEVRDLEPLMIRLNMGHHLPSLMQVVGITLGGRFDLPPQSTMIGLNPGANGPELRLEVMLGMIQDLPPGFLDLLTLGLSERPRELRALGTWLSAFTPEYLESPGDFSVLSVRVTPRDSARVSVYLRPADFDLRRQMMAGPQKAVAVAAGP